MDGGTQDRLADSPDNSPCDTLVHFVDTQLSYVRGADVPLLEQTISQAVTHAAARFADREALVVCHQNVRLTWRELDREVTRTARGLAGLGFRPGDRAGIWASNCVEWILMQHAASRAGIVLVNVNPAYRSHELRFVLKKSRIRALFLREKDPRANYREILAESRTAENTAAGARGMAGRSILGRDARQRGATSRSSPLPPTMSRIFNTPRELPVSRKACC